MSLTWSEDWRDEAVCASPKVDSSLFFPDRPQGGRTDLVYAKARTICQRCPVLDDCLEAAMQEERAHRGVPRSGLRGGMSPAERDRYARRVRWCACCGTRFVPVGREQTCTDKCRRAIRAEATAKWREVA